MRYHHIGIPVSEPRPGEVHLEHLPIRVSSYGENPYGIEWIRLEEGAPYPELVAVVPYTAFGFEVDDLNAALQEMPHVAPYRLAAHSLPRRGRVSEPG
jgi:hypothetical protein